MLIDILHSQIRQRYLRLGFTDGFFECGRFMLHSYERRASGSAGTLVLLHGLGTSSSTWIHILPRLDRTWNVLAVDLPGFGFSKINVGPRYATLQELHQSVAALIGEKLSQPFVLLGHSLGGWLAAQYAVKHTENVKHLILVDNAGILCEETLELGRAFQVESIAGLRTLLNKMWRRYPWYFKPFYAAILQDLRKRNVTDFVKSVGAEDFLNGRLGALTMAVTIIWGLQDGLISVSAVDIMKRSIPQAQVHLIDRCGHVPQLERPKEFAAVVEEILRQQA